MSVQAMQWVIEHSAHSGGDLLVLLMVANHAGSDGWECWPSVGLLARECRMTERNVQYILHRLEAGGEVAIKRGVGPHGTHMYQLLGVKPLSGRKVFRGAKRDTPGVKPIAPQGRSPLHPNHKEPSSEPSSLSFNAFWEAFPRHQGKGAARTAYGKALAKTEQASILAGAERYRDDPNRTPEFTCLPATWLNQERWDDDPLPSNGGRSRNVLDQMARELVEGGNGGKRTRQSSSLGAPRELPG